MDGLNERRRPPYAYVANAGISGHSTVHHRILLESKKNIHEADALVFLTGVNDLSAAVSNDGRPTQALLEEDASYLQPLLPHYKRLRLYHMARLARRRISRDPGTHDPELYRKRRQLRANKARVPLPNLVGSVKEYRDRLRRLSEYCRQAAKRCIFLTQPTIWKTAADSAEESQLWYGWVGGAFSPRGYVGSGELAQAMAMFNNELLSLCHAARLECYDLASAIPKTRNAFFDDCHFTEAGARMVADFVAGRLAEAAPFSYHSRPRDTLEPDVVGRAAGAGRLDGSRVMPPVPPQPGRPSGY
jgi:lysophospholipase L1-like esterase